MNADIIELGFLDISLYQCICPIINPRVIITEKQLTHIAEHHPDAYETTLHELKSTLENPDYIFNDDKHEHTGLIIKAIPSKNEYIHLVLKINANFSNPKMANSIIFGWKISYNRLQNYIRNKNILYKKKNI